MKRYIIIRLFQGIVTLFVISLVVFSLVRLTGDPSILFLGEVATPKDRQEIRHKLGLDKPLTTQYAIFIHDAARGDFGRSIAAKRHVIDLIRERLPNTLKLIVVAVIIGFSFGVPLGVVAAVKKGHFVDKLARVVAASGQSMPIFWLGIMLIEIFSVQLRVLPTSGMSGWKSYFMPAFCLGILLMAGIIRLLRASMLDALDTEYVKMARIKGVPEKVVIWKHAFRNSLLAMISFSAMQIVILITGSIAVETVFAWPGYGRMAYESIMHRDFPMIQGMVLVTASIIILVNLATDFFYAYLDPRIRLTT